MRLFHLNQSTEQPWHEIYIFLYVIFTLASFSANSLLLLALYSHNLKRNRISNSAPSRNARSSEKTRDILVAHLAVFDLLLSITMPFTAMDALSKYRQIILVCTALLHIFRESEINWNTEKLFCETFHLRYVTIL